MQMQDFKTSVNGYVSLPGTKSCTQKKGPVNKIEISVLSYVLIRILIMQGSCCAILFILMSQTYYRNMIKIQRKLLKTLCSGGPQK